MAKEKDNPADSSYIEENLKNTGNTMGPRSPEKDLLEKLCSNQWGYLTNGRDILAVGKLVDITSNYCIISPYAIDQYPKKAYEPVKRVWSEHKLPVPKDRSVFFIPIGKQNLENQFRQLNRDFYLNKLDSIIRENYLMKKLKNIKPKKPKKKHN